MTKTNRKDRNSPRDKGPVLHMTGLDRVMHERRTRNVKALEAFLNLATIAAFGGGIYAVYLWGPAIVSVVDQRLPGGFRRVFYSAGIMVIGLLLFQFRKTSRRRYGQLEVAFAAVTAWVLLGESPLSSTNTAIGLVGAAYLTVRGLDNWTFKSNTETDKHA